VGVRLDGVDGGVIEVSFGHRRMERPPHSFPILPRRLIVILLIRAPAACSGAVSTRVVAEVSTCPQPGALSHHRREAIGATRLVTALIANDVERIPAGPLVILATRIADVDPIECPIECPTIKFHERLPKWSAARTGQDSPRNGKGS